MRFRVALSLPLLVGPALVHAQNPRLNRGNLTPTMVPVAVAATVTIPAMIWRGVLGSTNLNLGYDRVGISAGGASLIFNGPNNADPIASSLVVSSDLALAAGSYNVSLDFVNVGGPVQINFRSATGTLVGSCSMADGPGYNNTQTCGLTFSFGGGTVLIQAIPASGRQMTLKQVTVTKYQ